MISNLELGKHDECHDMHVRIKLIKTRYLKQARESDYDRTRVVNKMTR